MALRLLSICPSYRRPESLAEMLRTFDKTRSPDTGMVIRLHHGDPRLDDYLKIVKPMLPENVIIELGERWCMRETLNHYTAEFPDIPYRQIITDDARYETPNWDSLLIGALECRGGLGFACGDDRLNDSWFSWQHPSMEIWARRMHDLCGYVYPVTMRHRGLDLYTKELMAALGICPLVPDVIIRHLHGAGTPDPDDNLKELMSVDSEREALNGLGIWRETQKHEQVTAIKTALGQTNESN